MEPRSASEMAEYAERFAIVYAQVAGKVMDFDRMVSTKARQRAKNTDLIDAERWQRYLCDQSHSISSNLRLQWRSVHCVTRPNR